MKSCYSSKIFDLASYLPARSLPAAALLALRRRPAAYGIRLRLCRAVTRIRVVGVNSDVTVH
ncbi:MAG: hypothetical protein ACR2L2_11895 [Acidobacteriota bacterium]